MGGQARTSTQDEVWNGLVAAKPDTSEDELGELYYSTLDEIAGEGNNGDLTPVQWGAVADKLGL